MIEYCIMHIAYPDEPHRIPPKKSDENESVDGRQWCIEWIEEWEGISPAAKPGLFYIAAREVSPWTKVFDG